MTPNDLRRPNSAVLRQACVEAHWLPHLRLRISQPGRTPISVARGGTIESCEFRKMVAEWLQDDPTNSPLLGLDMREPIAIRRSVAHGSFDGKTGLITTRFADEHTVVAFSTIVGEPGHAVQSPARKFDVEEVSAVEALDPELGVVLIHTSHETGDFATAAAVQVTMRNLSIQLAIGSIEKHLAGCAQDQADLNRDR